MTRQPTGTPRRPPLKDLAVFRIKRPSLPFYRFLYNEVGKPWLWYERRAMADPDLKTILSNEKVHVYALYRGGEPAGYVELDYRQDNEVELAYFGLLPWHIGNGIGPWFLDWAVSTAWNDRPSRLIVNTCNLDHPKAIIVYQQAGFRPYRQETVTIRDPRREPFWNSPPPHLPTDKGV
jgi:GNAT superfamily N-acetyltransferase